MSDATNTPELNPAYEELAAKFRAAIRETEEGRPDGTREGLETCAKMLDTYGPECFPANDKGQVHFARAMMESVADEIRAFFKSGNQTLSAEELTERFYLVRGQRDKLLWSCKKALAAYDAANQTGKASWSGKDVDEMRAAVTECEAQGDRP